VTASALLADSPLGALLVTVEGEAITRITWGEGLEQKEGAAAENALAQEALDQLTGYFDGTRRAFDLPLAPAGSAYQQEVWRAMTEIPYGKSETYGELAGRIGSVARAVGGACGSNPIPIVIPCHRVLGGGGGMVGFSAAGGVADKRLLLALERGEPALPFG
jgi:methylated-DNA-[protein]-cysteine S-methyltransferase